MDFGTTVAAISTPFGEGGIGIVRLSGRDAVKIAQKILCLRNNKRLSTKKTYTISYGYVVNEVGEKVDEVIVSLMKSPYSYTREDVVEINCHGGLVPLQKTLNLVLKAGAYLAGSGEFTKRAFLNGRLDLAQAEAVIDIIRAKTSRGLTQAFKQLEGGLSQKIEEFRCSILHILAQIEVSLDFLDDEIPSIENEVLVQWFSQIKGEMQELLATAHQGRIFKEGCKLAITGKPNVGKSSLLNTFLGHDRAIVTDIPGTTRDTLEEYVNIKGIPFYLIDTAGIREGRDIIEKLGVERSQKAISEADLLLCLFDRSKPLEEEDYTFLGLIKDKKAVGIINKADLPPMLEEAIIYQHFPQDKVVKTSLKTMEGLKELEALISSLVLGGEVIPENRPIVSKLRHKEILMKALESLEEAEKTFQGGYPQDLISLDLKRSLEYLGQITGQTVTDELINYIFDEFCVGK